MKKYSINGKTISIKPHVFEGSQSAEFYENQIYNSLMKIGVGKDRAEVVFEDDSLNGYSYAEVRWSINGKNYLFKCDSQENAVKNLGAVAQAITDDIRQITRGIKDLFLIMTQYEDKERKVKRSSLLNFGCDETSSEELFPVNDLKINREESGDVDEKFKYLNSYTNEKLDEMYFRIKEQCIKHNKPRHPLFVALKIIRQKRGLNL